MPVENWNEKPDVRQDRAAAGALLIASLCGVFWLARSITVSLAQIHTGKFLLLAVLLVVSAAMGWLLHVYESVEYSMEADCLILRQGTEQIRVPLAAVRNLYRWRRRWIWSGTAQSELRVDEVAFCPPSWMAGKRDLWVVVYQTGSGHDRGVCIRPSPGLLGLLKAWVLEHRGSAG